MKHRMRMFLLHSNWARLYISISYYYYYYYNLKVCGYCQSVGPRQVAAWPLTGVDIGDTNYLGREVLTFWLL